MGLGLTDRRVLLTLCPDLKAWCSTALTTFAVELFGLVKWLLDTYPELGS